MALEPFVIKGRGLVLVGEYPFEARPGDIITLCARVNGVEASDVSPQVGLVLGRIEVIAWQHNETVRHTFKHMPGDQHIALDLETTCPKCHKPLNQHVSGEGEVDTLCPSDNYQRQSREGTKTFLHTVCAVCGHPMYEHAFNYDEALCP